MEPLTLTHEEIDAIITGLQIRRNIVQTGSPNVSAQDAERMGAEGSKEFGARIKALDTEQMRLCILTEELIMKFLALKSNMPM